MTRANKRTLFIGLIALVLGALINSYHYSLQGAKGLYVWHHMLALRIVLLMGLVPLSVAVLALPLSRLKSALPAKIVRGISIALAVLVAIASLGLFYVLYAVPRAGGPIQPARLQLLNPVKGIVARPFTPGSGEAVLRAGPVTPQAAAQAAAKDASAAGTAPQAAAQAAHESQTRLLRLSFSSDPHWGADAANAGARSDILSSVASYGPDAFFMLGDTVEQGATRTQWEAALGDMEAMIPHVPLRVLLGNHDALLGGEYLYKKLFFPQGFSSDSGSPYYYSVDAGLALLVVLNLPWGTENYDGAQKRWLEKTLAAASTQTIQTAAGSFKKPVIVLSHSFFYTSGYFEKKDNAAWYDHRETIAAISPLLEKYAVPLVISGHNHYQSLLQHKGVSYAIVGAMGGKPDPIPTYISPAQRWLAEPGTYGRLDVEMTADALRLYFRDQKGSTIYESALPLVRNQ